MATRFVMATRFFMAARFFKRASSASCHSQPFDARSGSSTRPDETQAQCDPKESRSRGISIQNNSWRNRQPPRRFGRGAQQGKISRKSLQERSILTVSGRFSRRSQPARA
ncbi:MAG: hypothetical protein IOC59_12805 [Methylobacterium sp.]|nr:hypothetical protein [Methylobacterium sp.]MCA3604464.1 hypothetical protein [Methylobacterium sp.]MCA3616088.1 hypothetical protein [Methylobacterium sp.]MCA3625193.1 hypothetical protein [Methylobacterium sp.]